MKQFISVYDAGNINALVEKALMYKANPLQDKTLGAGKRIGLLFLNPSLMLIKKAGRLNLKKAPS